MLLLLYGRLLLAKGALIYCMYYVDF